MGVRRDILALSILERENRSNIPSLEPVKWRLCLSSWADFIKVFAPTSTRSPARQCALAP